MTYIRNLSIFAVIFALTTLTRPLEAATTLCPIDSPEAAASGNKSSQKIQKQVSYNDAVLAAVDCQAARNIALNCNTGTDLMNQSLFDAAIGKCQSEYKELLNGHYRGDAKKVEKDFTQTTALRANCTQRKVPALQRATCYFNLLSDKITALKK